MKTLIQGGTLITESGMGLADILVEGEQIAAVGEHLSSEGAEVLDAAGKLIFPGFIDAHTHMGLPVCNTVTADDFDTGTKAAILGGTTCIVDFATQEKGETLAEGLSHWHEKADGNSHCDYAFHMAIGDWNPSVKAELSDTIDHGITSFKVYLTYGNQVNDRELYEILDALKPLGGIVGVHCENSGIIDACAAKVKANGITSPAGHPLSRPDEAEGEAIHRLLTVARLVDVPVIVVHLSSEKGLEEIRRGRASGQRVYAETCPQYLLLDESKYSLPGFEGAKYICSPPLRKPADNQALWQALEQGEIDTVSTDHCSFTMEQKRAGEEDFSKIPGGMPGVEERVALMLTYAHLPLPQLVGLMSTRPAKLYGMYPRKGTIQPGSDADLVIWNPNVQRTLTARDLHTAAGYTPFEGVPVAGVAETVFLRGQKVVEDCKLRAALAGQYIPRERNSLK